jgi:hypothetical protein
MTVFSYNPLIHKEGIQGYTKNKSPMTQNEKDEAAEAAEDVG